MPASPIEVDVAIVGGGLSGCAAAHTLLAHGASVAVLEAKDHVGGRTEVKTLENGVPLELGGTWAATLDQRAIALAREAGVRLFPTYSDGRNLIRDGEVTRSYRGWRPNVHPHVGLDLQQAIYRFNRLARKTRHQPPWTSPGEVRLDGQTIALWIARNVHTSAGRDLLGLAVRAIWGCEPTEVPLLAALVFVGTTGEGQIEYMLRTDRGAQHWRLQGGAQQLSQYLVRSLGDSLLLNEPVARVEQSAERVLISSRSSSVSARATVIALPPILAGRLTYDPPVPADRDHAFQRMAVGAVIRCLAVYSKPFWRDEGLTGHGLWTDALISATYDVSPEAGSPGVLAGFVLGQKARTASDLPAGERRRLVLEAFSSLYGSEAMTPEDYIEKDWAADQWARGCFHSYPSTGFLTSFGRVLRAPLGRVHFAGTENARDTPGGMNGALEAGERAALAVLDAHLG